MSGMKPLLTYARPAVPKFGDVYHWPGDPPEELSIYLCSDPGMTDAWVMLWINRGHPGLNEVMDNMTNEGWEYISTVTLL